MQFNFVTLLASALALPPALAQPPPPAVLNYDTLYDDLNGSLSTTACSGALGNLQNFGGIPNFPHITTSYFINGTDTSRCGACELLFNRADGTQVVLPFTIINSAPEGQFVSSLEGMEDLTGFTRDTFPGDAPIFIREVPSYDCGF
jgi:hypothetical protein